MTDEMRLHAIRRETAQAERIIAQTGDFMGQRHNALVSDLSFLLQHLDAVTRERDEARKQQREQTEARAAGLCGYLIQPAVVCTRPHEHSLTPHHARAPWKTSERSFYSATSNEEHKPEERKRRNRDWQNYYGGTDA